MGRAFELRKGRKMKRWAAMSKTFTRIGKDIVMAIKEGGADPETNSKLIIYYSSNSIKFIKFSQFFTKLPFPAIESDNF